MNPAQQQKVILLGGISALALIMLALLAGFAIVKSNDLDDNIASNKRALKEIKELAGEYYVISQRSKAIEKKLAYEGPPLLTLLSNTCTEAHISGQSLKPLRTGENEYFEENSVELKAQGLTLQVVMDLLRLINASPVNLKIKTFKMDTPYAKKELLDITMIVSSYTLKKDAEAGSDQPKPEQ